MTIRNGVKIIVFNQNGQALLLRRSVTDDRRAGEWDIPGGRPGEDFGQAAVRELYEETGLQASVKDLRPVFAHASASTVGDNATVNRLLYVWHAQAAAVILSQEHDEMKWVPIEQVLQEFPHPVYNAGIAYALEHGLLN